MTSRIGQRLHAIKRLEQREGLRISMEDYYKLSDRVWNCINGRVAQGVEPCVHGYKGSMRNQFFVYFGGRPLLAGWSEETMQISTFLPRSLPVADREIVIAWWRTPKADRWRLRRLKERMASETTTSAEGAQPNE